MKRREFLKLAGASAALTAVGCGSRAPEKLLPFINPPENIVPGTPTWFATTCRQCPAGCGMWAKNREGHVIKVEGNPAHPINRGKLCARGQAGLQDLYNPDRLAAPRWREGGVDRPLSWDAARELLQTRAAAAGGKIAVLTGLESGYDRELLDGWLKRFSGGRLAVYEPIHYEPLREANRLVFGQDAIPALNFSECDYLVSVNADFLETWLSPVEFSAQFSTARDWDNGKAGFVFAGPRLCATAIAADRWLAIPAGGECDFAFALLAAVLAAKPAAAADDLARAQAALGGLSLADLASRTGVDAALFHAMARRLTRESRRPFVFAGNQTGAAVAANLINHLTGAVGRVCDFSAPLAYSQLSKPAALDGLKNDLASGAISLLLIFRANPLYAWPGFAEAVARTPFIAAIDTVETETTARAHLALPVHSHFETWGTYETRRGTIGVVQPTMGPFLNSAHLADILAAPSKEPRKALPHEDFARSVGAALGVTAEAAADDFRATLARGFVERPAPKTAAPALALADYRYASPPPSTALSLCAYPSLRWYDGRNANQPWMREIPDPVSNITWDAWLEVHPDLAAKVGVADGDIVRVETKHGGGEMAVHVYPFVHPQVVAAPLGSGRGVGRYAKGLGFNASALTAGAPSVEAVRLVKTGRKIPLAHTDGSKFQLGRQIARCDYEKPPANLPRHAHPVETGPARLPIAESYDPKIDLYPPWPDADYRWGMVVDLDKCSGCSACIAACYAENNVAVVGKQRIAEAREMAWIFLHRYYEPAENPPIRFLPMLCQHCQMAPCESVCPVFAPTHDPEGINVQAYNRCIGTRDCGQNCPYKVRRFNWYRYDVEKPMDMQLNPDVTQRQMGVMEKCSFCIQRIKDAHQIARREHRKIREGEVTPACVQACPTGALSFGSYLDPESKLRRLGRNPRAYQVLAEELNTLPGVIYLKKIVRDDRLDRP